MTAVAHDGDPLADRKDLFEPVRNEEHGVAVLAQCLDDLEQLGHLGAGQRSRRLIHHDHSSVRRQRLGDLDELLVGDRKPPRQAVRVEPDTQLSENRRRLAPHPPGIDTTESLERLHADEHVLGDRQVGEERRLLKDDGDPGTL